MPTRLPDTSIISAPSRTSFGGSRAGVLSASSAARIAASSSSCSEGRSFWAERRGGGRRRGQEEARARRPCNGRCQPNQSRRPLTNRHGRGPPPLRGRADRHVERALRVGGALAGAALDRGHFPLLPMRVLDEGQGRGECYQGTGRCQAHLNTPIRRPRGPNPPRRELQLHSPSFGPWASPLCPPPAPRCERSSLALPRSSRRRGEHSRRRGQSRPA